MNSIRPKTDSAPVGIWGCHQIADGVKDDLELRVVLLFEGIEFPGKVGVRGEHLAQADEGTHDLDVDLDSALAVKDA